MKRIFLTAASLLTVAFLAGCAHPINMRPDVSLIQAGGAQKINKVAGYHISDANLALEVTTPGGGGDKVRYFPYRDVEAGFYKALSETFTKVSKIANPKDTAALNAAGINLLITPEITTTSYSPSPFTWPPTQFTVTLDCQVVDASGKELTRVKVTGTGKAEFDEFKANFSLSAVRASEDALKQLMAKLRETAVLAR
jgi:hypothetical protein